METGRVEGGGAAELFCRDGNGRNEVGSRRVWFEMPRRKGDDSFPTRLVRRKRRLPTFIRPKAVGIAPSPSPPFELSALPSQVVLDSQDILDKLMHYFHNRQIRPPQKGLKLSRTE